MMSTKDPMSLEMLKAIFATPWRRVRLPEEDRSTGGNVETDLGLDFLSLWAEMWCLFH